MIEFPTKFLIDGIDRLGKSSLIKKIQDEMGYYLVIHYDKPKLLGDFLDLAKSTLELELTQECPFDYSHLTNEQLALFFYQEQVNFNMFELLKSDAHIIFDRTHLGEMVYAPMYRKYPGDYIYEIEKDFTNASSKVKEARLVLLTTSNFGILEDDGLSFDFSKKEIEQKKFIEAFDRSSLTNKVLVDVHDGQGKYRSYDEIFEEVMFKSS